MVISTVGGVISNYKYSYLNYNPIVTKSHDPLSGLTSYDAAATEKAAFAPKPWGPEPATLGLGFRVRGLGFL